MKIACPIIIVVLFALYVRTEILNRRYRAVLVHERMTHQMMAIQDRARAFVEMHGNLPFTPEVESAFMELYELRIKAPDGNASEFYQWMKDFRLEVARINGWPSVYGVRNSLGLSNYSYKVFYGQKPPDWDRKFLW